MLNVSQRTQKRYRLPSLGPLTYQSGKDFAISITLE